ncbi:reverse transcriptase/maturase family protein [Kineosporia corallincola]
MQSAETVLGVLRERGRQNLPLEEVYRQLFNPQLYLLAHGRIYSNGGAMTPGVTEETADGMSTVKVGRIIDAMRHERYRFSPSRRVHIPKKNGATRPLGMPTWSDKLVGEVIRLILEAYYEPMFSDRSHGFRPGKGCHTALTEVALTWTGTTWFIEADLRDCFGSLDHDIMLTILGERIHDKRFLRLVRNMLQAGYLEDWVWGATFSGAPQGGVASPVLSNIYLDRLDRFVEDVLIPEYTRGGRRKFNPAYQRLTGAIERGRKRGDRAGVASLRKQRRTMPSLDMHDPGYRRLRYIRYADDHLLGFTGPKAEAEQIKSRLTQFLRHELKLELSQEKTLITNARSQAAQFLGYDICAHSDDTKGRRGRRFTGGFIKLSVPPAVIKAKSAPYRRHGKPAARLDLVNRDDYSIVATFGAQYRGIVQYYLLAGNVYRLNRLEWAMQTAMLKTLATKHRTPVSRLIVRHKTKVVTPQGLRTCFEATVDRPGRKGLVARFGGIPLKRNKTAVIRDRIPNPLRQREVTRRLIRGRCELCENTEDIQIHQIRRLADLTGTGRTRHLWEETMARKRRKTLIVCGPCHSSIHATLPAQPRK